MINDVDKELECYEYIGQNFYYLGNLPKALYYHDRSQRGLREADNSPSKKYSEENLEVYKK